MTLKMQPMRELYPSSGYRAPDDYSLPLYVAPSKAVWYHRHGDKVTFETRYDDFPAKRLAEQAREVEEMRVETPEYRNMGLKKIASVPMSVYFRSMREKWDQSDWKRWFNDPDNKHLRVWQGGTW